MARHEVLRTVDDDDVEWQLRQASRGWTEDRLGVFEYFELRLVARAEQTRRLLLVQRCGAARVRADLGEGDVLRVVRRPTVVRLTLARLDDLAGTKTDEQGGRRCRLHAV